MGGRQLALEQCEGAYLGALGYSCVKGGARLSLKTCPIIARSERIISNLQHNYTLPEIP